MSKPIPIEYVAGLIYDGLREEVIAAYRRHPRPNHRGCLSNMDKIWPMRSSEVHGLFRRVAAKVMAEVTKDRPMVVRKCEQPFRVVSDEE